MQLFAPNNHSEWRISYRLVEPVVAERVGEVVHTHWGAHIGDVTTIEQVNEAEINSSNFKITTNSGVYVLRKSPLTRVKTELVQTHEIMEDVREQGVPAPQALRAVSGDIVVEESDGSYVLYEFITADHYRGTQEELADCGCAVGKLDAVLATLASKYETGTHLHFTTDYIEARRFSRAIWDDILAQAKDKPEAVELMERTQEVYDALEYLEKNAPTDAQTGLVHFDLHPHNLLADGTRIVAILDFDSLRYVERMRAFAFALHRAVRQYIVYTQSADPAAAVRAGYDTFVTAYRDQNELSDAELATVKYFIKHESLSRLTYSMKDFLRTGIMVWKTDISKQLANIAEADFFVSRSEGYHTFML